MTYNIRKTQSLHEDHCSPHGDQLLRKASYDVDERLGNFSTLQKALFVSEPPSLFKGPSWEDMEDRLAVLLSNDTELLELFHCLFQRGVKESAVLASLSYLVSLHDIMATGDSQLIDAVSSTFVYVASFDCLARFLVQKNTRQFHKLECIRVLLLTGTNSQRRSFGVTTVSNALAFVLDDWEENDDDRADESYFLESHIFWELRLQCLQEINSSEQTKEIRRQRIKNGANTVAVWLWSGASAIDTQLSTSAGFVTDRILDPVGIWICANLEPQAGRGRRLEDERLYRQRRLVTTCAGAAKQASDYTYHSAQSAVSGLRDASVKGISSIQGPSVGGMMTEDGRVVLAAAGQVGMASLAAATLVGESVVTSTRTIADKTVRVTADVVQHKYGPVAGATVRDVTDTVGNVMRTMAYVAMFKGTSLTKMVAKETSKEHIVRLLESRRGYR